MPWHRDQPWHLGHESVFAAQGGNLVIHPRPADASAHAIRIEPGAADGLADPAPITPPTQLAQPDFGLTLTVHMAALVAVDALARGHQAPTDPAALSVYLLNREHGHWRRLHESRAEGTEFEPPPSVMARVVFARILTWQRTLAAAPIPVIVVCGILAVPVAVALLVLFFALLLLGPVFDLLFRLPRLAVTAIRRACKRK